MATVNEQFSGSGASRVRDVVRRESVPRNCSGRLETGGGRKRFTSASFLAVGEAGRWGSVTGTAVVVVVVVMVGGRGSEGGAKGVRVSEGGIRGKAAVEKT